MVSTKTLPDFTHHVSCLPPESVPVFNSLHCSSVTDEGFRQLQPLGFYGVFHHQAILGRPPTVDYQSSRYLRTLALFSPNVSTPPKVPPLNSCHLFSSALVSVNPLLVVATGGAVAALEHQLRNYYVFVDNTNIVPYGQLPTIYCGIVR